MHSSDVEKSSIHRLNETIPKNNRAQIQLHLQHRFDLSDLNSANGEAISRSADARKSPRVQRAAEAKMIERAPAILSSVLSYCYSHSLVVMKRLQFIILYTCTVYISVVRGRVSQEYVSVWQRGAPRANANAALLAVDVAEGLLWNACMDDMYGMGGGHIADYPSAFSGISVSASDGNYQLF